MNLDLIAPSNLGIYNIKIAQLFGLKAAVYLAELITINDKAVRKEKIETIDNMNFFTVVRTYITSRTTLTAAEQKEIEGNLNEAGILKIFKDDPDTMALDIDYLGTLLGGQIDPKVVEKISNIAKKKTVEDKIEAKYKAIKDQRLKALKTTNPELRTAYSNWIEAGLSRYGGKKFTNQAVRYCESQIEEFAGNDIAMAVQIINSNNGYTTMQYAIDNYKNLHTNYNKTTQNINWESFKNSSEVF